MKKKRAPNKVSQSLQKAVTHFIIKSKLTPLLELLDNKIARTLLPWSCNPLTPVSDTDTSLDTSQTLLKCS